MRVAAGVNNLIRRPASRKTVAMSVELKRLAMSFVGRLHFLDFVLELVVDGAQLLVEGLQLLLGGLQLLVGGLEFLVHRHDFFVRRFEFLVGTLHLLDGALQVIARGLQLLLKLAQQVRLCRLGARSCCGQRFTRRIRLLLERDQQQTFGLFGSVERLRLDVHPADVAPMAHHHAFDALGGVFADGPADDDAQLGFETLLARESRFWVGGPPGWTR